MSAVPYPLFWTFILASVGFVASVLLIAPTRWVALRSQIVAKKDLRRRHNGEIPLLGGTALYGTLVLGAGITWLTATELLARDVNWLSVAPPCRPILAGVKIRYRSTKAPATVEPLPHGRVRVAFDAPQRAVTPGQAAVFYDADVCLGGGWIES